MSASGAARLLHADRVGPIARLLPRTDVVRGPQEWWHGTDGGACGAATRVAPEASVDASFCSQGRVERYRQLQGAVRSSAVLPALGGIEAWIVDDGGLSEEGQALPVGVARQYCGQLAASKTTVRCGGQRVGGQ